MKLSRNITNKINYFLDQIVPPFIRDSYWFMMIPFRLLFGKKGAEIFMNFKDKVPFYSEKDFLEVYSSIDDLIIQRETDLNTESISKILENIDTDSEIIEVGCGRGFLANLIFNKNKNITPLDIYIEESTKEKYPHLNFLNANIENLPFETGKFEIVICTHTLEHVQNFQKAFQELRRICSNKLIVVIPCQRPYKYTFDLHLQFFPYVNSFLNEIKPKNKFECTKVSGDIFYIEYTKTNL